MSVAAYNGRQNLFEVLADESSAKNFIKKSPVQTPPPPKKKETKKDDKKADNAPKQERTSEKISDKQDQKIEGFQEVNRSKPENKEKKNQAPPKDQNRDAGQRAGGAGEGRGNRPGFEGGRGRGIREGGRGAGPAGREGFQRRDNTEGGGRGRGRDFREGEGGQGGGRGYREGGGRGEGRGYREGGGSGEGRGYREGGGRGEGRGRARDENRVEGAEGAQGGFKEGGGRGNYEGRRRNYEGGEGGGRGFRGGEGGEGGERRPFNRREGEGRPFRDSSNFYHQSFESTEDNPNLSAADIGISKEAPSQGNFRDRRDHVGGRRAKGDVLVEDASGVIRPKNRIFERKSGNGRPIHEQKKHGAGKANWGSTVPTDADLAEDTIEITEPAEVKPKQPADESTEDATTSDKPEGSATSKTPDQLAADAAAKEITYSEYIQNQKESKANITLPKPTRKAGEGVTPSDEWADAVPLTRETEKPYYVATGEKPKKKEKKPEKPETKIKPKKETLPVEFKVKQKQPSSNRNDKRYPYPGQSEQPAVPQHEETPSAAPAQATSTDEFPTLSKKA